MCRGPAAVVPGVAGEGVAGQQYLSEGRMPVASDREQRRCFHLDHQATFVDATINADASFAIDRIGGPGASDPVGQTSRVQGLHQGSHRLRIYRNLPAGRQVVMGSALVTDGAVDDDGVTER